MYVVTVVLALTLIPENDGRRPSRDWVAHPARSTDTYTAERLPQGLTQMWSLAAEVAFYAVLPLLMCVAVGRGAALRPGARARRCSWPWPPSSVVWHLDLADPVQERSGGAPGLWLPAFLTWFAVGIGLALVHVLHQPRASVRPGAAALDALGATGVCWAMVGGLLLVAATPVAGPDLFAGRAATPRS